MEEEQYPLQQKYDAYTYDNNSEGISKEEQIVFDIIADIKDRRGLKSEWNSIDEDIVEEIIEKWTGVVKNNGKATE